jgi:hypothetical protein
MAVIVFLNKDVHDLVHDILFLARVALAGRVDCRRVEAQGPQPCARCAKARWYGLVPLLPPGRMRGTTRWWHLILDRRRLSSGYCQVVCGGKRIRIIVYNII